LETLKVYANAKAGRLKSIAARPKFKEIDGSQLKTVEYVS